MRSLAVGCRRRKQFLIKRIEAMNTKAGLIAENARVQACRILAAVLLTLFVGEFAKGQAPPNDQVSGPVVLGPGGLGQLSQNNYPNQQYYIALEIYREGDLANAAEAFDAALRFCRKDTSGRWIDAIPVHAMLGECFYFAGDLSAASEQIDFALDLAGRNRGWLASLDWTSALNGGAQGPDPAASWASPNLPPILPLARKVTLSSGSIDLTSQIQRGGKMNPAQLTSIDAVEIMRGLAIAAHRRRVIYGPLAEQTELLNNARNASLIPKGLTFPAPRAIIVSMLACERFAAGLDDETLLDVKNGALVGGAVHPLTPITLLVAARILAQRDKFAEAVPVALQAAAAASALRQPEWVGEAMMVAVGCVDATTAPLIARNGAAAAASHLRRGKLASAGSLLAACEAALLGGDVTSAQVALSQVNALLEQRDMLQPRLSAHGEYLIAVLAAQTGGTIGLSEPSAIDAALTRMYTFALGNGPTLNRNRRGVSTPSTPRLFQLGLVNAGARNRGVGGKVVDDKINQYALDPTAAIWRADPVDALGFVAFDRSQTISAQIVSAVKRKSPEDLLVLSDALLRHRFLATQAVGGRVLQTRRLASTDKTLLSANAAAVLAKPSPPLLQMVNILATPAPLPGSPELSNRGQNLESLAALVALQRGELPKVAPPAVAGVADLKRMPKTCGLLIYTELGGTMVAALCTQSKVKMWTIAASKPVGVEIAKLLREIGVSANRSASRLEGEKNWKAQASALRRKILPDEHLSDLESLEDLIIVPDGFLWYLPMELLPLGDENAEQLGDKLTIRYSPTPGLAIHPVAYSNFERPIGLVSQLFFAPRDGDANQKSIDQISEALKASTKLPGEPAIPGSLLGESVGPLAVLGLVTPNPANPFAFSPTVYDATDPQGSLAAWMRFPSRVPPTLFLPGFRTAAASPTLGDGRELFMTLTALHCSGVRDVVISRWPVGGESTAILSKEFLQELPFEGLQPAWRRAVQALRQAPLSPEGEPLLGAKDQDRAELTGDHPIFWSSYIVDTPFDAVVNQ